MGKAGIQIRVATFFAQASKKLGHKAGKKELVFVYA